MSEFEQWIKTEKLPKPYWEVLRAFTCEQLKTFALKSYQACEAHMQAAKQSMQGDAVAYLCEETNELTFDPYEKTNNSYKSLYTHAPDSAAVIADLQAQVEALKVKAERWEKCKTMSKQWWLNAIKEAGLKGGRSLDEQIDAAISKGGE